jgi:hypothetical protein
MCDYNRKTLYPSLEDYGVIVLRRPSQSPSRKVARNPTGDL